MYACCWGRYLCSLMLQFLLSSCDLGIFGKEQTGECERGYTYMCKMVNTRAAKLRCHECVRSVNQAEILPRLSLTWSQYLVPGSHSRISDPIKSQVVNWLFSMGLTNSCYLRGPLSQVTAPADLTKTSLTFNHIQITCTKNMKNEKKYINNFFIRVENDLGTYSALWHTANKWQWTVSQWWLKNCCTVIFDGHMSVYRKYISKVQPTRCNVFSICLCI